MRAEPLLSQHRQKPWVSMAKIFEVEDSISHADGELSGPVDLVSFRSAGLTGNAKHSRWLDGFFWRKGHQKKGEKRPDESGVSHW